MKLEEFDKFAKLVLDSMNETNKDEFYGSEYSICKQFLESARLDNFSEEIKNQEEYQEYLRLKAKFEPETK